MRRLKAILAALALLGTSWSQAAELVMFERDGCIWCLRWERDVGPIYPKTPEGQRAPLRKINLDRVRVQGLQVEGLRLATPIRYTPTFVLIDDGREVGRMTGFIDDDSFWGLLGIELKRLGTKPD